MQKAEPASTQATCPYHEAQPFMVLVDRDRGRATVLVPLMLSTGFLLARCTLEIKLVQNAIDFRQTDVRQSDADGFGLLICRD